MSFLTFVENTPKVTLPPGMVYMAVFDAKWDFHKPDDWRKWLPECIETAIKQLQPLPRSQRCLHIPWLASYSFESKKYGTKPDGSDDYSPAPDAAKPIDITVPAQQMLALYDALKAADALPSWIYIDHEEDAVYPLAAREIAMRAILAPFRTVCPCVNFNWIGPRLVPYFDARMWRPYSAASINGPAAPQCYIGWQAGDEPTPPDREWFNTPEAVWLALLHTVKQIRTCRAGARQTIPWLPVCHPDAALARKITRDIILHSALSGVRRWGWAMYMTQEREQIRMADAIAEAMTDADELAGSVNRQRTWPITAASTFIRTGPYQTSKANLVGTST